MADVKGRRWPSGYPFTTGIVDGATNETLVRDGFVFESRHGDFKFKDAQGQGTDDPAKVDRLEFNCPHPGRPVEYCGSIKIGHLKKPEGPGATWLWDGNFEKPTLTPSVNCQGCECKWHGWLQGGVWRSC